MISYGCSIEKPSIEVSVSDKQVRQKLLCAGFALKNELLLASLGFALLFIATVIKHKFKEM